MTKSDWADYSKTFECKAREKFKVDAYMKIRENLNFLMQRRNRGFFNKLRAATRAAALLRIILQDNPYSVSM